jgi:hypothetical protein
MYGRRAGSVNQTEEAERRTSGYRARTGSPSRSSMWVISGATTRSGRAVGLSMYVCSKATTALGSRVHNDDVLAAEQPVCQRSHAPSSGTVCAPVNWSAVCTHCAESLLRTRYVASSHAATGTPGGGGEGGGKGGCGGAKGGGDEHGSSTVVLALRRLQCVPASTDTSTCRERPLAGSLGSTTTPAPGPL